MGEGRARAHLGGDPDRLHDLFRAGARAPGGLHMALDAPGTLRDMRHRHRDQLLVRTSSAPSAKTDFEKAAKAASGSGESARRRSAWARVALGKPCWTRP